MKSRKSSRMGLTLPYITHTTAVADHPKHFESGMDLTPLADNESFAKIDECHVHDAANESSKKLLRPHRNPKQPRNRFCFQNKGGDLNLGKLGQSRKANDK